MNWFAAQFESSKKKKTIMHVEQRTFSFLMEIIT